jgi:hypothetical protein
MHLSKYLGIPGGHANLNFVDVDLDRDNLLFIDPYLNEHGSDDWSTAATHCMRAFFDTLYNAYRVNDDILVRHLLSHAGEINATKFGYGNGFNGKGRTGIGLYECFQHLGELARGIRTITKAQDIPVFVRDFAEDNLSDMLTNILHKPLNEFTLGQLAKYGIKPNGEMSYWTFDPISRTWVSARSETLLYQEKEVLLVPKGIVRKNYLGTVDTNLAKLQ